MVILGESWYASAELLKRKDKECGLKCFKARLRDCDVCATLEEARLTRLSGALSARALP